MIMMLCMDELLWGANFCNISLVNMRLSPSNCYILNMLYLFYIVNFSEVNDLFYFVFSVQPESYKIKLQIRSKCDVSAVLSVLWLKTLGKMSWKFQLFKNLTVVTWGNLQSNHELCFINSTYYYIDLLARCLITITLKCGKLWCFSNSFRTLVKNSYWNVIKNLFIWNLYH